MTDADADGPVDGTVGLDAAAFDECPECGRPPVAFVTVGPDPVFHVHVDARWERCTVKTNRYTRVVFHARSSPEADVPVDDGR